jgi:hypothetical protein
MAGSMDLGRRQPARGDRRHSFPTHPPLLAATPKRPLRVPGDVVNEGRNRPRVRRHGVIREIPAHDLAEPASLLRHRHMEQAIERLLDLDELGLQTLSSAASSNPVLLSNFIPTPNWSAPRVFSRFLSLLQSLTSQTFSTAIRVIKKASFRAVLRVGLGVRISERYANSLSERPSLSEALADLLYKLFPQRFQCKSIYRQLRSCCFVRPPKRTSNLHFGPKLWV